VWLLACRLAGLAPAQSKGTPGVPNSSCELHNAPASCGEQDPESSYPHNQRRQRSLLEPSSVSPVGLYRPPQGLLPRPNENRSGPLKGAPGALSYALNLSADQSTRPTASYQTGPRPILISFSGPAALCSTSTCRSRKLSDLPAWCNCDACVAIEMVESKL
jgi:hypothetical protein